MCCCIWHVGNNCAIVSWSGYIWIWSGACNQESINHSACCIEWKSKSVTMFIVVSQFLLTYERSRIQCLLLSHNFYKVTKGAVYNRSWCPSISINSVKSKSGIQHALFLLSVYMIPIIQRESYSQVALLIRRLPSNRPTAMLMIYKLLSCYPILTKKEVKLKEQNGASFIFFHFHFLFIYLFILLLLFFSHQQHITEELLYFQNNFWFLFKSYHADQLFFLDHAVHLCVS